MFLLREGYASPVLVTSASDLTRASQCEFGYARDLDVLFGRTEPIEQPTDVMLERTAGLGLVHEGRIIERYRQTGTVLEIARPENARDLDALAERQAETLAALTAGTDVVVQATFIDLELDPAQAPNDLTIAFNGYADFLVRQPDGRYLVQDSKLARRAKVTALFQLAAYVEQLTRLGIATDDTVDLVLGDHTTSTHRIADIAPVLRVRRARLHRLMRDRWAATAEIAWRDARVTVCGTCAWCAHEIARTNDVWQVAGLTGTQWTRLAGAGITTLPQLAGRTAPVDGIGTAALQGLALQASLQSQAAGAIGSTPPVHYTDLAALGALPAPSPGDIFFDFEGDPLYTETNPAQWGLDYLFGFVDARERFTAYWAHSFADERQALLDFVADVERRRAEHPDLHIYHYAAYERTHLRSLAARHGVAEDTIDEWLRTGVLVDLYPIVKRSLRVGTTSYSIKYLEPLYFAGAREGAAVARGDDSVAEYVRAMGLRAAGDEAGAQGILTDIADYNEIDCVSTLKLAAWLRQTAVDHGVQPGDHENLPEVPRELEPSPLRERLLELAANPDGSPALEPDRTPEQRAYAYAAAAIDYHRREHKTFWWEHFDRLVAPLADVSDTRDVFTVDADAHHEQTEWGMTGKQRSLRRRVRLVGTYSPGSRPSVGGLSGPFALYEQPSPFGLTSRDPLARATRGVTIEAIHDDGVTISETLAKGVEPYRDIPVALTPGAPPPAGQQKPAIEEWGATLVAAAPEWPRDAVADLLRRVPPVTRSGRLSEVPLGGTGEPDRVAAVVASLRDLDHSYLAVQGPPGTGKTYLGSRVIAQLARDGWRIGVVAQGHSTVEHMLTQVVDAGLPGTLVGKAKRSGATDDELAHARFTVLGHASQLPDFTDRHAGGYVIGGTAWDFSNPSRVDRRSLDLLVIDEAGQFSLAATVAASMSAQRVLLLGDPQQLPQVSQGAHPEPIDGSALGYLSAGHDVLPTEYGYFLAETRRMHPALTEHVSHLSYQGELRSHWIAATRELAGVTPGLHPVPVEHEGNATSSAEEAERVVAIVRDLIGREWYGNDQVDAPTRELDDREIIVVTPYNAQQQLIREHLDAAGFRGTRVGTVDKFQGQEAVIAIVSMTASSAHDVPRGMEFLLMRNRLNVAISRAQFAAYLVYSPGLIDHLPHSPSGVAELSAFVRLVEPEPGLSPYSIT